MKTGLIGKLVLGAFFFAIGWVLAGCAPESGEAESAAQVEQREAVEVLRAEVRSSNEEMVALHGELEASKAALEEFRIEVGSSPRTEDEFASVDEKLRVLNERLAESIAARGKEKADFRRSADAAAARSDKLERQMKAQTNRLASVEGKPKSVSDTEKALRTRVARMEAQLARSERRIAVLEKAPKAAAAPKPKPVVAAPVEKKPAPQPKVAKPKTISKRVVAGDLFQRNLRFRPNKRVAISENLTVRLHVQKYDGSSLRAVFIARDGAGVETRHEAGRNQTFVVGDGSAKYTLLVTYMDFAPWPGETRFVSITEARADVYR